MMSEKMPILQPVTVRFVYQVTGVLKFLSHLDLLKLFNRALLRANLPVAYSEGFNPHPKISFGPPRGVGQDGLQEMGDLQLREAVPPEEVCQRLNQALPAAVRVLQARLLTETGPALMAVINLAVYEAEFPVDDPLLSKLSDNVQAFLAADKVEIVRYHPKKRPKTIDLRAGVQQISLLENRLHLEIPFAEGGSVKASEVLQQLLPPGLDCRLARAGLFVQNAAGERRLP